MGLWFLDWSNVLAIIVEKQSLKPVDVLAIRVARVLERAGIRYVIIAGATKISETLSTSSKSSENT